jgi:tetratricopeptide (TPR) repeat protein
MAWIRGSHDWDWRGAEASCARALELAPGSAEVVAEAGLLARSLGRLEDALSLCRRAMELDPLSVAVSINLGLVCHVADQWAEAEVAYRRALELAPQRAAGHAVLSLNLLAQGRSDEALAEAMREPHDLFRLWALAIVRHVAGQELESDSALREMIERHAESAAFQIAEVHGARGETDAAFDWLDRAYAQRDPGLGGIVMTSPRLRSMHVDLRWAEFLKRMGFEN